MRMASIEVDESSAVRLIPVPAYMVYLSKCNLNYMGCFLTEIDKSASERLVGVRMRRDFRRGNFMV